MLFGGLGVVFLFGAPLLGLEGGGTARAALRAARGPWGLPLSILVFAGLAFLGAPQIVLIGAAVLAFGPWRGLAYSWVGTLVSALVGFALGRRFGAALLREVSGPTLARISALIGQNGFLASFLVRLAPFAPFIVVNMAAGMTPMSMWAFAAGTALGILPKIALVAFAGRSLAQIWHGAAAPLAWLALAGAVWLAGGWAAARWLGRAAPPRLPPQA